jgi:hypothetical protein
MVPAYIMVGFGAIPSTQYSFKVVIIVAVKNGIIIAHIIEEFSFDAFSINLPLEFVPLYVTSCNLRELLHTCWIQTSITFTNKKVTTS